MQKLTIYDISKLSGVSISTVSRVINGHANVNQETRDKVEAVIRSHGYVPRQRSRNFSQKSAFAVGLMLDDVRHAYMSELAHAINMELEKWRVNMILCNIANVEKEFIEKVDNLIDKQINGIIVIGSLFEKNICKISMERRYTELPFVAVNANFALPNVWEVLLDQVQGTIDAVSYVHRLGRRRIGWICSYRSNADDKKHQGFLTGMRRCGLQPKRMVALEESTLEAGKLATRQLLAQYPDTDAILYSNDILAVGGAHHLHDNNISIPDQVALVGFNNSSGARECYPPLTSIDNRIAESGRAAAQIMMDVLNKQPPAANSILLPCSLAVRESTEKTNNEGESGPGWNPQLARTQQPSAHTQQYEEEIQ